MNSVGRAIAGEHVEVGPVTDVGPGPLSLADQVCFAFALHSLKCGMRVARAGWNGKGMWLILIDAQEWGLGDLAYLSKGDKLGNLRPLPWIGMKTADGGFVPWLASQTDILATDWVVVS